ncbi:GNAT family N-acetyltransferase [Diaphorobacter sp. HDW4A]|uniref:GNAT family N-acetyltransferase n=1 Tax=Diaphorobacter sp. HDW4A TaxID=2714924 RepID=UPI001409457D|nr:GNAT family N-acetyltransferase [Diaphorobacter sp. HDW4A]QIL82760.1 GNAT family N-acetyltransferase [Diaphorobacter sp. HDW4A]
MIDGTVRPLRLGDLPGLLRVQRACYGEAYVEGADVFSRRIASAAHCSLVLETEGVVCAYLAAYRSCIGKVTPLHGDFGVVSAPDTLYLHDMAVHPEYVGQGLAHLLLQRMREIARDAQLPYSGLVSVQGSQSYWARQGYVLHPLTDLQQQQCLASYGDDAVYMLAGLGFTTPLASIS